MQNTIRWLVEVNFLTERTSKKVTYFLKICLKIFSKILLKNLKIFQMSIKSHNFRFCLIFSKDVKFFELEKNLLFEVPMVRKLVPADLLIVLCIPVK